MRSRNMPPSLRKFATILMTAAILFQTCLAPVAAQDDRGAGLPVDTMDAASPQAGYSISGRIVDGGGNPVSGVTVTATAGKTPVVFVPGITGSYLREDGTDSDLWPGQMWGTNHAALSNRPGERKIIVAPDVVRELILDKLPDQTVYAPVLAELARSRTEYNVAGDPTRRTTSGCDLSQAANQPTLFVFAYDWRLGNDENANRLADYIGCIHKFYPGAKVDIVAHSMGGLVARRYILKAMPDHSVRRMITVGTPWLGAPKFLDVLETGDLGLTNVLLWRDEVRRLLEAFPGAHELLPSATYFEYAAMSGEPRVFTEKAWDINDDGSEQQEYDYNALVSYVNARYPKEGGCGSPTDAVCRVGDNNQTFHSTSGQDTWTADPGDIEYRYIVGVRSKKDTIAGQIAQAVPVCSRGRCRMAYRITNVLSRGDGTVPLISARRAPSDQVPVGGNVTIERFTSIGSGDDAGSEHLKMLHNPAVLARITELLDSAPGVQAAALDETIPPAEPAYYLNVLGANVAYVTDSQGQVTGIVSPTLMLREADEVTFLPSSTNNFQAIIPTSGIFTVTFQSGELPMVIDLVREGDGDPDYAARWRDLAMPPNTAMQLVLSPLGVQELRYDASGDGTPDTAVSAPAVVAEGPGASDTTAPTVTVTLAADHVVTITAEDETGVAGVYYSFDNTSFLAYTGPVSAPYTATAVYAFADDTLANRSSVTILALTPDVTAPTTSIAVEGPQDGEGAFTGAVTVTVSATDAGSGVDRSYTSLDGGQTWQEYGAPLSVGPGQAASVQAYSVDKAGNQEYPPQERSLAFAGQTNLYLPAVIRGGANQSAAELPASQVAAPLTSAAYPALGPAPRAANAPEQATSNVVFTVTTGADGNYTFSNLPAGSYTVAVSKPNFTFSPASRTVSVPNDGSPVSFTATPTGLDTAEEVLIPAGSFLMGCDSSNPAEYGCNAWSGQIHEQPLHSVYLDAYTIDKYEVTNARYAACVAAGGCTAPGSVNSSTRSPYYGSATYADYPVINVDWNQARAFCEWEGKRLPTEAEWEKAARGSSDTRVSPWGDSAPDCTKVNYWGRNGCVGDTSRVGSYASGASPYGAMDMVGNVWEWVNDWYQEDYYSVSPGTNPLGPATGGFRMMRGGSWVNLELYMRSAFRGINNPDNGGLYHGFRCARSQ